jgi:hypothetical protein
MVTKKTFFHFPTFIYKNENWTFFLSIFENPKYFWEKKKKTYFSSYVGNFFSNFIFCFLSLCSKSIFSNSFAPNSRQNLNAKFFIYGYNIYMNTPTLVVILLTILSILVFLKSVPFIFLSSNMLNIDKYFGANIEPKFNLFDPNDFEQNLLSFMFIILAIIIVYKRNFNNDIVNYIMYYLIIINIVRFYFVFFSQTQLMSVGFQNLVKITIVNMFLLSLYVIKKIFF